MTITAAIVLFSVTWFLTLFIVLAIGVESQGDTGEVVAGTPPSAPQSLNLPRKLKITTAVSALLFVLFYGVITSGYITLENMDVFGVMQGVPKPGE